MDENAVQLEIRAPTEEELDSVFAILNRAFDDWPGRGPGIDPRLYLTWKCHSSPQSMDHHALVLFEGEAIGSMVRIARAVKVRNEVLAAQQGADGCLIPEFRGRGFLGSMRQYGIDQATGNAVAIHLDFSRHPAVARSWVGRGLIVPENGLTALFKPLNAMSAAGRMEGFAASMPRPLAAAGIKLMALASTLRHGRSKPPADEETPETIEEFDESVNSLWESASKDFDFIPVRDSSFLNWRYCDPRGGEFTVRMERSRGELAGYCVLKFVGGRAYIADLLVRSGRLDVVERLVWDAVRLAKEQDSDGIICHLPASHPYRKTLLRAGFFDTGRKADFSVAPMAIDPAKLAFLAKREAKIHVTLGDSDLI